MSSVELNARLYKSNHNMQDEGVQEILRTFQTQLNWKNGKQILDIGCGPGDITVNYLLKLASDDAEITGIDVSLAMLKVANEAFQNRRLKFLNGDISDPKFSQNFKESFDMVFSFYTLHWVQSQEVALRNIYNVLKPGGETLLTFVVSNPLYDVHKTLSKRNKWSFYLQNYKQLISPYHNIINPKNRVENLLSNTGFDVKICVFSRMCYTFPSKEILYKTVESIDPHLSQIPEHLQDEYREDFKQEFFSNNKFLALSDSTGEASFIYTLVTVLAEKPLQMSC